MPDTCPICKRPTSPATRPFCSSRCADIDLGRWLTEQYAVAGPDGESEAPAAAADDDGSG